MMQLFFLIFPKLHKVNCTTMWLNDWAKMSYNQKALNRRAELPVICHERLKKVRSSYQERG